MPPDSCALRHHTATLGSLKYVILAVDTSLGTSVAIVQGGEVLASLTEANPLGHAEVIGDLLQRALAQAGVTPAEITTVVTGMGPGPFTGLRVGIATARAFAIGVGAEVYPVPSHLALANEQFRKGVAREVAIVTDARRREVAITGFAGVDVDGVPNVAQPTALALRADVFPSDPSVHVTQTAQNSAESLQYSFLEPLVECVSLDAGDLGLVAERAIAARRTLTSGEPLYLRVPDVAPPKAVKS